MKDVLYLASEGTLPGSPRRRTDAFEHDQMIDALTEPLGHAGLRLSTASWDDPKISWSDYDGVLVGTPWDYAERPTHFLQTLKTIEQHARLFNPSSLIEWNTHKTYLRDLSQRGLRTLPTLWLEMITPADIEAAFAHFQTDDLIFKRQIGAGAEGQFRLRPGIPPPDMPHPMMVQAFQPSIIEEGEFSFIFIDGHFSHALIKRAAPGDYRIQSKYGGQESPITPSAEDLSLATACLTVLEEPPLYARVDMIRASDGCLCLMELELIEPFLYPKQGPDLGLFMAEALAKRLTNKL